MESYSKKKQKSNYYLTTFKAFDEIKNNFLSNKIYIKDNSDLKYDIVDWIKYYKLSESKFDSIILFNYGKDKKYSYKDILFNDAYPNEEKSKKFTSVELEKTLIYFTDLYCECYWNTKNKKIYQVDIDDSNSLKDMINIYSLNEFVNKYAYDDNDPDVIEAKEKLKEEN